MTFAMSPAASWALLLTLIAPIVIACVVQLRRDAIERSVRRHPGGRRP